MIQILGSSIFIQLDDLPYAFAVLKDGFSGIISVENLSSCLNEGREITKDDFKCFFSSTKFRFRNGFFFCHPEVDGTKRTVKYSEKDVVKICSDIINVYPNDMKPGEFRDFAVDMPKNLLLPTC